MTFFIVMVGWTIFRATASLHQAGGHAGADGAALRAARRGDPMIPSYYWLAALIGAGVVVAQRAALSIEGFSWMDFARRHAFIANTLLALLFVAALAKGLADPFKPFIYFRF